MLIFKNEGEIDVRSIKTFGVSAKENDSAIGYFGTGLKYAIAVLLREKQDIEIWSGDKKYTFGVSPVKIRNSEFELITMNGEELGFTTELGKMWNLWQAYRELYCNCIDEHGKVTALPEDVLNDTWDNNPVAGYTHVFVSGEEIEEVHNIRDKFIIGEDREPLYSTPEVDIYEGESQDIFYRGINIGPVDGTTMAYTYDIKSNIDLTEDRTLKYSFEVKYALCRSIAQHCRNENILRKVLCSTSDDSLESLLPYESAVGGVPSEPFIGMIENLHKNIGKGYNFQAKRLVDKYRRVVRNYEPAELNQVQLLQLGRAIEFAKNIGFPVNEYPIVVTQDLGDRCLGYADISAKHIYLSLRPFEIGTKMVANTLIEEFIHIKYGVKDYCLEMQNLLFDKIVSLGEQLMGEPI